LGTGDQYSIADLHLAGWLARVAKLAGGTCSDDGHTVVKKLEEYIGGGFKDEESKLGGFWDAVRERKSWQKVYGAGLY
jgi:glutathione S-transferase